MTKIRKGESSVGNIRKPGGGRKKLKPEYDAVKNLKEQIRRKLVWEQSGSGDTEQ